MSLTNHFGLCRRPFQLVPDPGVFVPTNQHRRVLVSLLAQLEAGSAGAAVIGAFGLGKSTLLGALAGLISERQAHVTSISIPPAYRGGVCALLAQRLGLPTGHTAELMADLEIFFDAHCSRRFSMLIVDNAHHLSVESIAQLHQIARSVRASGRSFAVLLAGRAKLAQILASSPTDLKIAFKATKIDQLSLQDQQIYVRARFLKSGWRGDPAFGDEFAEVLASLSRGVPRTINYLLSRVLAEAAIEGRSVLDGTHILNAAKEMVRIRRRIRTMDTIPEALNETDRLLALRRSTNRIARLVDAQRRTLARIECIDIERARGG